MRLISFTGLMIFVYLAVVCPGSFMAAFEKLVLIIFRVKRLADCYVVGVLVDMGDV